MEGGGRLGRGNLAPEGVSLLKVSALGKGGAQYFVIVALGAGRNGLWSETSNKYS